MINIRQNIFETNSSSTHAAALVSKRQLAKWKNGDVYLCFNAYDWHIPATFTLDELFEYLYNPDGKYDDLRDALCDHLCGKYTIIDGVVQFYDCLDKLIDLRSLKDNDHDGTLNNCLHSMWIFEPSTYDFSWEGIYANDPINNKERVIISAEIWD